MSQRPAQFLEKFVRLAGMPYFRNMSCIIFSYLLPAAAGFVDAPFGRKGAGGAQGGDQDG